MIKKNFFSVRMRASKNGAHENGGKHISGGELISPYEKMKDYDENPFIIESWNGIKVKDIVGKEYYDGFSALWLNVHGHRKKE